MNNQEQILELTCRYANALLAVQDIYERSFTLACLSLQLRKYCYGEPFYASYKELAETGGMSVDKARRVANSLISKNLLRKISSGNSITHETNKWELPWQKQNKNV